MAMVVRKSHTKRVKTKSGIRVIKIKRTRYKKVA